LFNECGRFAGLFLIVRLALDLGNIANFIPLGLPCNTTVLPFEVIPRRRPATLGFTGILLPLQNQPLWSFLEIFPPNTHPKRWRALDNCAFTNVPGFVSILYLLKKVFMPSVTIGVYIIICCC